MKIHRWSVRYEKNVGCLMNSIPNLEQIYASEVLNYGSQLTLEGFLEVSMHVYLAVVEAKRGKNHRITRVHPLIRNERRFRSTWYHSCALCIGTTWCLIFSTSFIYWLVPDLQRAGSRFWLWMVSCAIIWYVESCGDSVYCWARYRMNGMFCWEVAWQTNGDLVLQW